LDPLDVENWRNVSRRQIRDAVSRENNVFLIAINNNCWKGGASILSYYSGSIEKALNKIYPELKWEDFLKSKFESGDYN
jgi:hypothetical protein